jgi:hypothetical protein
MAPAGRPAADLHRCCLASMSDSQAASQPENHAYISRDRIDPKALHASDGGEINWFEARTRPDGVAAEAGAPRRRPHRAPAGRQAAGGARCPGRYVVVRPACVEGGCPGAARPHPHFPRAPSMREGPPAAPRWRAPAPPLPPRRRSRHRPARRPPSLASACPSQSLARWLLRASWRPWRTVYSSPARVKATVV